MIVACHPHPSFLLCCHWVVCVRAVKAAESSSVGTPKLGGPFDLVDSKGKPVTDKDFLGRYVLLYFGFTHCPDICPSELKKMEAALALLDAAYDVGRAGIAVQPVFISVDPKRDTPKRLEEYKVSGASLA